MQVRVEDLHASRRGDIRSGYLARSLLAQVHKHRLILLRRDHELLQVQNDLGNVFLHTGNGGELVKNAVDANRSHGRTGNRRKQGPPKRIADRVTESGLERLNNKLGAKLRNLLLFEDRTLRNKHDYSFPRTTAI